MKASEEDTGKPGKLQLTPQGAAITKVVVEMLGESIGGGFSKTAARAQKVARKSFGGAAPAGGEKIAPSVQGEHNSYLNSLKGDNGVAIVPVTTGKHGATLDNYGQDMLDGSKVGNERLTQYKAQLADPEMEHGPSMIVTLDAAQLPKIATLLKSQSK
jgi:hypothetical protein